MQTTNGKRLQPLNLMQPSMISRKRIIRNILSKTFASATCYSDYQNEDEVWFTFDSFVGVSTAAAAMARILVHFALRKPKII